MLILKTLKQSLEKRMYSFSFADNTCDKLLQLKKDLNQPV